MDLIKAFDERVQRADQDGLPGPELLPERLALACAAVLPVQGAGISMVFAPQRRLPMGASSPDAATAERLQFTVGAGPCLHAHDTGDPVVADEATLTREWPAFAADLVLRTPIRAVVSVPLSQELRGVGALDLYFTAASVPTALPYADTVRVAGAVAEHLGRGGRGNDSYGGPAWLESPRAQRRARVWQAIGLVNVGLGLTSADALALLRAYAFGHGQLLDDLAVLVLEQRLPLGALRGGSSPSS